ncbi:MAG: DNA-binding response regulator [Bacteroidia bacterium]|nr:MAG: DNA-binding response regulator [Bacteroidia bacterium]
MDKIRTLIIDDEKNSRDNTRMMLNKYFSEIEIIGEAEDGAQGRNLIGQLHPDLVFLDVNMPELNGLEMLESIPEKEKNFYVIFLTAYDEYAIPAIRAGAVDYLMKPLMKEELMQAIKRVSKFLEERKTAGTPSAGPSTGKLMVSHSKGFNLIDFNEIIMLEAAGNYTDFYLTGKRKIISSRTLKDYEDILDKNIFFRVSRSAIVNLNHIKEYNNNDEMLTLSENRQIHIVRTKWTEFNETIKKNTINPQRN